MSNVFISHIVEEAPLASVLKEWLESAFAGQISVFVSSSEDDVSAGDNWLERINRALEKSQVLIVICSPSSVGRPWINFEAGCGWIKNIPILPICHSGQRKNRLPPPLSLFQALEVEDRQFSRDLVSGVGRHLAYGPLPRLAFGEMNQEVVEASVLAGSGFSSEADNGEGSPPPDSPPQGLAMSGPAEAVQGIDSDSTELVSARCIITTDLDSFNNPLDNVTGISLATVDIVTFYFKWFYLTPGNEYKFIWHLIDGLGDMVIIREFIFQPTSRDYNTWHPYRFNKRVDLPGDWTIVALLDGIEITRKGFNVEP